MNILNLVNWQSPLCFLNKTLTYLVNTQTLKALVMMAKNPKMAIQTPSTQKLNCWMILYLSELRYPQVSSMEVVKLPSKERLPLLWRMISERFIFCKSWQDEVNQQTGVKTTQRLYQSCVQRRQKGASFSCLSKNFESESGSCVLVDWREIKTRRRV